MKGDFTRLTFRPKDRYSRVLQQQGRVQLDADWNEQVAIDLHRVRTTTSDVLGACGAPCGAAAFEISADGLPVPTTGCTSQQLRLEAGHYYVDGILVEVDEPVHLDSQPDLPGVGLPSDDGRYLVYLDVWEQHLTALERPAIREVALGGPDTTTRARTVWQAKVEPLPVDGDAPVCSDLETDWTPAGAGSSGRLAARAAASGPITDPCIIPPGAGFRRLENQLYRVEIHDGSQDASGSAQPPTYVWSRENGSVVLEVSGIVDTVISVTQPARDAVLGFAAGDWVEISDEGRALRGEPGILVELADAQGTELTVAAWGGGAPTLDPDFPATVRRWESAGATPVATGSWLDLEDGVQVQFEAGGAQAYRTGDYWLIPARTADIEGVSTNVGGDVEWPQDPATGSPAFLPRQGIDHHYCPIALLDCQATAAGTVWTISSDCRHLFPSLTDLTHLVYLGGDGQEAMPGDPLPQPLEVAVWNGGCAVGAAVVQFKTEDGGVLSGGGMAGDTVVVSVSGPDAIASCAWTLKADWATPSQLTRATLLDDHGLPVGLPIDFTANLSIASQVAYDPDGCKALAGETTVQAAIHHLAAASSIVAGCGDGQEAMPGAPLPQPIEIEVASACGPTKGAKVEFTAQGAGSVAADPASLAGAGQTFGVTTGADGRAQAVWQLDPSGPPGQRLEVKLLGVPGGLLEEPTTTCFVGQLAEAGLYYVSGDGQEAAAGKKLPHPLQARVANGQRPVAHAKVLFSVVSGNGNVAGDAAIDASTAMSETDANGIAQVLWTLGPKGRQRVEARLTDAPADYAVAFNAQFSDTGGDGKPDAEPGLHVVRVILLADGELQNDEIHSVDELREGILIALDGPIDPRAVERKPILIPTVELPYPDGDGFVGAFQPLVLRGAVGMGGQDAIRWAPDDSVIDWLKEQVARAQQRGVELVLARLVLKGNFVWGEQDPSLFVDGDAFGTPAADGRTDLLRRPDGTLSGDDHRGGDFEMWYWLVP